MTKYIFLFSILLLTSCNIHKATFDCGSHKGAGCKSVSEVNEIVNHNRVSNLVRGQQEDAKIVVEIGDQTATRTKDKVMKIWFAGYVDGYDNLRGEQVIHALINKGIWQQEG